MKKLMIYPFTYENREVLMYRRYIENYELTVVVTLNATDERFFKNQFRNELDIHITSDFEDALEMCDSVFFLEDSRMEMPVGQYEELLELAEGRGKEVLLTRGLGKVLAQNSEMPGSQLRLSKVLDTERMYLKPIDAPVVGIMGLGSFCGKFCTELEIMHFFREQGYKVLYFATKDTAVLFGGVLLPDFLFDRTKSVTDRILGWNHYVFHLCHSEKPNIIVMGMPGGIMPLNHKILMDFGEIPFILSNGFPIDVGILCSYYYEKIKGEFLENYRNYCKYRLNCDVKYISISNSACIFEADSRESEMNFLHYDKEITNQYVLEGDSEARIFSILNDTDKKELLHMIYEELTEGIKVF